MSPDRIERDQMLAHAEPLALIASALKSDNPVAVLLEAVAELREAAR